MIITDLNYLENTSDINLVGGTAAVAASSSGGVGVWVSAGTNATSNSSSGFYYYGNTSSASTSGYARAKFGIVSSNSFASSFA